jgi:hypothetical protein
VSKMVKTLNNDFTIVLFGVSFVLVFFLVRFIILKVLFILVVVTIDWVRIAYRVSTRQTTKTPLIYSYASPTQGRVHSISPNKAYSNQNTKKVQNGHHSGNTLHHGEIQKITHSSSSESSGSSTSSAATGSSPLFGRLDIIQR